MTLKLNMAVEDVGKEHAPGGPIEINTKLVPLERLIYCLRRMLGKGKFTIEMRHDVYKIESEKSIDAQDIISQCRSSGPKPEIDLRTPNSATSIDGSEELARMN
ncbi:hypothetical protein GGR58DRAFT_464439 [Xylaria digitata]|nr:hypothetical protein GGR58DRAFT_464439 [Xylaria digitata]